MGVQKRLGNCIRKIDFLGAKEEYDDNETDPSDVLHELESQLGYDDSGFTWEELLDGYAAFKEKVCINKFPGRHSPAFSVAHNLMYVLERLARDYEDDHQAELGKLHLTIWLALLTAGPSTGHIDCMDRFMTDQFEEYIKSCPKPELVKILQKMKIKLDFYPPNHEEESEYADLLRNRLSRLIDCIPEAQHGPKGIQTELLDLYQHYIQQLAPFTPTMQQYFNYMIRDMTSNCPEENPYLGWKNVAGMKAHLLMIQKLLMDSTTDLADLPAERVLKYLFKAAFADGIIKDIFGTCMDVIVAFAKKESDQNEAGRILDTFETYLFRACKNNSVKMDVSMFDLCLKMISTILSSVKKLDKTLVGMIEHAYEDCVLRFTEISAPQMKSILELVITMLKSGFITMIKLAKSTVENKIYKKALVWKNFLPEARVIFVTVGEMPVSKMEVKWDEVDSTCTAYGQFMDVFLKSLTKGKVIKEVQGPLVICILKCLSPHKTEIAEKCSDSDYLSLSKVSEDMLNDILEQCDKLLKDTDLEWDMDMRRTVQDMLSAAVDSYNGNGNLVTAKQNGLFMSIFKTCLSGETIEDQFYLEDDTEIMSIYGRIYQCIVMRYMQVHRETSTVDCCAEIIPDVLRWAKLSHEESHEDIENVSFGILCWLGISKCKAMVDHLPMIMELYLTTDHISDLYSLVTSLYEIDPKPVHDRLDDFVELMKTMKDSDLNVSASVLLTISQKHPETFNQKNIMTLLDICKTKDGPNQLLYLQIIRMISEKCPKHLEPNFAMLIDDKRFPPYTLNLRTGVIACVAAIKKEYSETAIDYLMKYVRYSDPIIVNIVVSQLSLFAKTNTDFMQKHRADIEKLETQNSVPHIKNACHDIINMLDGKSIEGVYDEVQQTQEDVADLDKKVDVTVATVIQIGDKVVQHDGEIQDLKKDVEVLDERVDNVEVDLGETKVKVEEIDNKTMTNAPKWSRDLTKLMNPKAENDWRFLTTRLGYSNDDIRAWAQQNDPCMAMLSEWYATHKTSEANHAVLTALQEMNRLDGAVIVENALKASEGVVEDEEFEYPSPPPIFLSYQWGIQEEVKLLKHHLNMAGYECWMDIGQMGGGDKLFSKIDNGIRAAKMILCCTTEKYAQSPNCNREVNLSVSLGKPIIPLLMEKMDWPPKGAMGPIFSEYLFIRFFQRGGEETTDQRYWPIPKFQELLMQLNFFVVPDQKLIQKEYKNWWSPMVEEIKIDKNKGKSKTVAQTNTPAQGQANPDELPVIFLSYQWGKQPQIKVLYQRLTSLGFTVWMDIHQMGGGDSLYDKIDRGLRGCKAVVSCMTPKYSLSANCRREISLADALKKPIIPLLLEQMKWPPTGPMSMVFTELLFINFYRDQEAQMVWKGDKFDELMAKLNMHVPEIAGSDDKNDKSSKNGQKESSNSKTENKPVSATKASNEKTTTPSSKTENKPVSATKASNEKTTTPSSSNDTNKGSNENKNSNDVQPKKEEEKPTEKKSKSCIVL